MNTLESSLSVPCSYRVEGMHCAGGILCKPEGETVADEAFQIEGQPVLCPACEGRGRILTRKGEDMLIFFQTFLRPVVNQMVEDAK